MLTITIHFSILRMLAGRKWKSSGDWMQTKAYMWHLVGHIAGRTSRTHTAETVDACLFEIESTECK